MQDPNQSRIVSIAQDDKKVKKQIVKVLNKDGKYETKLLEIKAEPASVQIERYKREINQNAEVIRKLHAQSENLHSQVGELQGLLKAKIDQKKAEEKQRIQHQKQMVKNKQAEIVGQKMSPAEISKRVKELDKEIENAKKTGTVIAKDLEAIQKDNEDVKVLDQMSRLNSDIQKQQEQLKLEKIQYKQLDKEKKENEKKLQKMSQGKDEAQEFTRLTSELYQLKEKANKFQEDKMKGKQKFDKTEELIQKYKTKYEELKKTDKYTLSELDKEFEKNEEFLTKYQQEDIQAQVEKLDYANVMSKIKKDKAEKKDKEQKERDAREKELEEQKKSKIPKPIPRPKGVKELIQEQDDYSKLQQSLQNYLRMMQQLKDMEETKKKTDKWINKELSSLKNSIDDIKNEIITVQQLIKEKDKERELAESKCNELKLLVKNQTQLEPLSVKKTPVLDTKQQLEIKHAQKIEELNKNKDKIFKRNNVTIAEDPNFYKKSDQKQEHKNIIDKLLDCQFKISKRFWFGYEPVPNQTQIRDDVHVVTPFSINHRIHKITFYSNPTDAIIYGFTVEYIKDLMAASYTIVTGEWNINMEAIKQPTTKTDVLELGSENRIKEIIVQRENTFISTIVIKTRDPKVYLKVGKEIEDAPVEKEAEKPQDPAEVPQEVVPKKVVEPTGEIPTGNPDRYQYRVDQQSVVVTFFGGLNVKQEKTLGLTFFGFEVANKLGLKEKEQIRERNLKLQQKKQVELNKQLLEKSMAR